MSECEKETVCLDGRVYVRERGREREDAENGDTFARMLFEVDSCQDRD